MKESIKKLLSSIVKSFFIIFIPILLISVGILAYINYISILKEIDIEFKSTKTISELQLLNALGGFYDISRQISLRTAAKENLKQFIESEKSFNAANKRISQILKAALKGSDSIKGIKRFTNGGMAVASVGETFEIKGQDKTVFKEIMIINISQNHIIIKSPVLEGDIILGYDYILFSLESLKKLLVSINMNNHKYKVMLAYNGREGKLTDINSDSGEFFNKTRLFHDNLNKERFELENNLFYITRLEGSKLFLVIKAQKSLLYEALDNMTRYLALFMVFIVIVLFMVFKKMIYPLQKRIENLFRANEELRDSLDFQNRQLESLFATASDGIHILDCEGNVVKCNQAFVESLGYTIEEALGLNVKEWNGDISPDILIAKVNGLVDKPEIFETRHKRKNGTLFDAQINAKGIELNGKKYLYASQRDITEQKLREKLILEQKEEFETIFESTKDGIAIINLETRFINCNNAFLKLTGFTKEEILTKSCRELTLEEDLAKNDSAIEFAIKNGQIENIEKRCINKNGKIFTVNFSVSLLPDKKRLLLSVKDMTSFKLLEEQSKLASMGEMIGNIAHQWRQPLSIITTSSSALDVKADFGEQITREDIKEFSNTILSQANYLSKTIDDFKNFIRGNNNYLPISIKEALQGSLALTDASRRENFIILVADIEEDLVIRGNINELEQSFINILNNAKDILTENDEIEERYIFISLKKIDDKSIKIKILDNGGGVKEEVIDKIFEPYFTTKHQSVGTGLGLSMVDKIIRERHNGTITVHNEEFIYSDKKYKGACFTMIFKNSE